MKYITNFLFFSILFLNQSVFSQNTTSTISSSQAAAIEPIANVYALAQRIIDLHLSHGRILFVSDIDGVLTNDPNGNNPAIAPRGDIVKLFKTLSDTGHNIVFSSAWNNFEETLAKLKCLGLEEVAKTTEETLQIEENRLQIIRNGNVASIRSLDSQDPYFRKKAFAPLYASELGAFDAIVFIDDSTYNCRLFAEDIAQQDYAKEKPVFILNIAAPQPETAPQDMLLSVRISAQTQTRRLITSVKDVYFVDAHTGLKRRATGEYEKGRIDICEDFLVFHDTLKLRAFHNDQEVVLHAPGQIGYEKQMIEDNRFIFAIRFDLLPNGIPNSFRFSILNEKRCTQDKLFEDKPKFMAYNGARAPQQNSLYFDQGIFDETETLYPSRQVSCDVASTYIVQEMEEMPSLLPVKISYYITQLFARYNGHALSAEDKKEAITTILKTLRLKGWLTHQQIPAILEMYGF